MLSFSLNADAWELWSSSDAAIADAFRAQMRADAARASELRGGQPVEIVSPDGRIVESVRFVPYDEAQNGRTQGV